MFSPASRRVLAVVILLGFGLSLAIAQTKPAKQDPQHPEEVEILKTDTDLVTVPVIATDKVGGLYVTDLRKEEFAISEDDVKQEIAFFGKVAAPFHVVLMLDTSSSPRGPLRR